MRVENRNSDRFFQAALYDSPPVQPGHIGPLTVVFPSTAKGRRAEMYAARNGFPTELRSLYSVDESISDHPHTIALNKAIELGNHLVRNANSEEFPGYGNDVARILPSGKTRENRYKPNVETLEELEQHLLTLLYRPEETFALEVMSAHALSGKYGQVLSSERFMLVLKSFTPAEIHYFLYGLSRLSSLTPELFLEVCAVHETIQKYRQQHGKIHESAEREKDITTLKNIIDGLPLEDETIASHILSINGITPTDTDFPALEQKVLEAGLGYPTTLAAMSHTYQAESRHDLKPQLRQVHPLRGKKVNGMLTVRPTLGQNSYNSVGNATDLDGKQLGMFSLSATPRHIEISQFASQASAEAVLLRHLITVAEHLAVQSNLGDIRVVVPVSKGPVFQEHGFQPTGEKTWSSTPQGIQHVQIMHRHYNNGIR